MANAFFQAFFTYIDETTSNIYNNFNKVFHVDEISFQQKKFFWSVFNYRIIIPVYINLKGLNLSFQGLSNSNSVIPIISDFYIRENKYLYYDPRLDLASSKHLIEDISDHIDLDINSIQLNFLYKI